MNISSLIGNAFAYASVRTVPVSEGSPVPRTAPESPQNRADLLQARSRLISMVTQLQKLAELLGVSTRFRLDLPDARSSQGLGLDLTSAAATLRSVEEINASPHSFAPFGPAWTGASTALITVGGAYDGSNGTGSLSFEVRGPGTHGVNNLRIRVRDPLGNLLSNLNIQASHPPDRQYGLGNGLYVTLGSGNLSDGDTTSVDVFQNVGSVFDPTLPFNGTRNSNPGFQYYDAPATLAPVVDGSFMLNGESIAVSAGDSLNDVASRINASTAGVTALFNPASERLELTQNTEGATPTIVITGDTSNLIQAAKLSGATVVPGIDPESARPLGDVGAFSAVTAGSFTINNTPIAIDPASDSLDSVIASINASSAQVAASFDTATQRVLIEAENPASTLEIDGNGTGLFAALRIPEGRVDPVARQGGFSRARSYDIADRFESVVEDLNRLLSRGSSADGLALPGLRDSLAAGISSVAADTGDRRRGLYGLAFDGDAGSRQFASLDRRAMVRHLQVRGDDVKRIFGGSERGPGTIDGLFAATVQALEQVNAALGASGRLIDTFA